MTLSKLALAALLVTIVFAGAAWLRQRRLNRGVLLVCVLEAGLLTLLAALWFGSLGTGGWLTVFVLLGALAGTAERGFQHALTPPPHGPLLVPFLVDVARYGSAGALLAWSLG